MDQKTDIRTLRIAGQDVRVAIHGAESASRTLLVFNGIGASLETVAPFATHFRDTRVVTFDVPGVGGSPTPALPYRFAWLTRLAARLLDALGIGEVDVFGVSWGGALAQQFAHDFPARCRSLTLAATCAGFVMVPGSPRVLKQLATPRRYADPAHLLTVGPDLYGGLLRYDRALLAEHAQAMLATSRRGYLYQLLASAGWTSWLWLPRLTLPVLILMGDDDPIVPVANGRILANRLPDARLEIVACGHLFILTDPAGTAARIERFLAGDDRPAPAPARPGELVHP
ncbi:poly(3-hydroxyalkanoate) depolymerase [Amaricoccus sp.]|uniref:poly(3-hydroxyalkanoate) depolymerase n=1 Tax=Amaricoccus sp. TaxID=1872485 RepID=UPI0026206985|nr:poly(3-hydroxyalkanoate) depolymerase [Amaricoccus sp.]HRO09930.1 poly(3-hydroxyalkanoate) depolymerase [Amaricoccus sp.]